MANELVKRKLPTIQQLYSEDVALAKQNDLNIILNQIPKKEWIKQHPFASKKVNGKSVPLDYLPIGRVEWLMTNIFIKKRVEILDYKLIGNSVCVHVRLHYADPISGTWDWQDGLGANPLQTDSGAGAIEFDKLKTNAVQIALPAAESYAVKDAAEKIGRLFGSDLNRADEIAYDTLQGKFDAVPIDVNSKTKELIDLIDNLPDELEKAFLQKELETKRKKNEITLEFVEAKIKEVKAM